jgi:hypothetical protein
MKKKDSIDRFALKRDKEMTPGARLDWLAAAREFAMMPKKMEKKRRLR